MYSNQPTNATFVSSRKKMELLEKQKRELTVSLSMFEYEIKRLKIKNRKLDEENRRLNGDIANQSAHFVQDKRQLISDVQVSERNRYRNNEVAMKQQLQLLSKKIEEQDALLKKQYKNNYVLSLKLNVAQADLSKVRNKVDKYQKKYEKEVSERSIASKQAEEYREQITSLYDQKDTDEQEIKKKLESAKKRILELERAKRYDQQTHDRIKHDLEEKVRVISHQKEVVQDQAKKLQKDFQEAVLQQVRLKREITDVQHSKSHLRTSLHQTMRKLKIANHEIRKLKNTVPSSRSFSNPKVGGSINSTSPIGRSRNTLLVDDPTRTPPFGKLSSPQSSHNQTPPSKRMNRKKKEEELSEVGTTSGTLILDTSLNEDFEKKYQESEEKVKILSKQVEEKEKSSTDLLRKYNVVITKMSEKKREIEDLSHQMKNVMYKNYCLQQKLSYQQKRNFKQYDIENLSSQLSKTKSELSKFVKQNQIFKMKTENLQTKVKLLLKEKKTWSDQKVTIRSELEREKYINQILRLKKVDNLLGGGGGDREAGDSRYEYNEDNMMDDGVILMDPKKEKKKSRSSPHKTHHSSSSSKKRSSSKFNESSIVNIDVGGGHDIQMLDPNFTLSKQQLLKERNDLREVVQKLMTEGFQLKQKIMKKNSELEDAEDLVNEVKLRNSNFERKCKMLMTKLKETLEANQMWKVKFSEIHQNMIRLKKVLASKNIDLEKILDHFSKRNSTGYHEDFSMSKKEEEEEEEIDGEVVEEEQQQQGEEEGEDVHNEEEEEEEVGEGEEEEEGEEGDEENGTRKIVKEKMDRRKARLNKKRNDIMRRKVIVLESNLRNSDTKNKKMMQSIRKLKKMVFKE